MKQLFYLLTLAMLFTACSKKKQLEINSIESPSSNTIINFYVNDEGEPIYMIYHEDKIIVDSSALGFVLGNNIDLTRKFQVVSTATSSFDQTWEQPWGEQREIRNNYNELKVELSSNELLLNLYFRAYDDGVAFRYEFPEQNELNNFTVIDEITEFNMPSDHDAWWIPAYSGNRYEYIYTKSKLSEIEKVHTPFTIETDDSLYLHIHEAALYDYSSMIISGNGGTKLSGELIPFSTTDSTKAYLSAPFKTPWRTIQIAKQPQDLITNYLILNLNEPNKLGDVSWVEPGKYIGVWWEMFIGIGTWFEGPKHAANTANVKKYIDFASEHGFKGVLVEGWNYGWDDAGKWINGGTKFEFDRPFPDFDVDELSKYGKEKDVYIIGHHETGADTENYDQQLEKAHKFLSDYGMKVVKTGYVEHGDTLPNGMYHHSQYFVQHFQRVIETAAKHKNMIVAHEPIKDTGKRRTYPNMVSREGAKGQEYNAMGGNPVDHVTILPFTRCLAGPFDYTPGVFDIKLKTRPGEQIETTLCRELALYVCIYAPMQMANDLPENYDGHPAFQFIKDVPTDWETTKAINGKIGDYVTIARKERDSEDWYLGSINDETARTHSIKLDFLNKGQQYKATIYRDAKNTHYLENPTAYEIEEIEVNANTTLELALAPGGGVAIQFKSL